MVRTMTAATRIDTQPPSKTLTMLETKKPTSMKPNTAVARTAVASGHFHDRRITTNSRTVVISMLPVTEMPYAEARSLDSLKPTTSIMTLSASSRLTRGM